MTKKEILVSAIKENCIDADKICSDTMSDIAGLKVIPTIEDEALFTCYKWAFQMLTVKQLEKLKEHSALLVDEAIARKRA